MNFIKTYTNFTLSDERHLEIKCVKSHGNSIEELISNSSVQTEDWNGDNGPYRTINDLAKVDISRIIEHMLEDLINYQAEYYSRGH